ncbi:MAG: dihydrodipicolinate synthase family protein [Chloroflexi bacterium]|nr:dihydrodipicolinate synthase family protein [Chloroflexota bacterium]
MLDPQTKALLLRGMAIPAHPLALTEARKLDERRQRALTRYYCDAGAGGIAVGVHTTQFAIRDPQHGLYQPVLRLARETADDCAARLGRRIVKVAGVCGRTDQAIREAQFAAVEGYDLALLSLGALADASDDELLLHCRRVAQVIPLFGFYLQPAAGGRVLSQAFWRKFVEIPNVCAIKTSPFNRYQTVDVLRAVVESSRANDVALYTGNDDNILVDLFTSFPQRIGPQGRFLRIVGGLLGQWAVWTRRAADYVERARTTYENGQDINYSWLQLGAMLTDANGAIFDAAHGYAGCIPGIHEVLRRQGLLAGTWCLDPHETLSPGQSTEIDRVCKTYPYLSDDAFVAERRDAWLS